MKTNHLLCKVSMIIGIALLTACTRSAPPTPTQIASTATPPPQAKAIRIGGIGPLSAPGAAEAGIAMHFAMNLAVNDINAKGGVLNVPIELIFVDTQGSPERGTAVAERLINEDKVAAIVGEYHSAVGLAVLDVAHKYGAPVLFSETWADEITETGYPEVFRIAPVSSMESRNVVEWFKAVGVKHFVIITENTEYGLGQSEQDKKMAQELGLTVDEVFVVELGTQDLSPVLNKIKAMEPPPDAIRTTVTGTGHQVERQMSEMGIAPSKNTICFAEQTSVEPIFWENVPKGTYCTFALIGLPPSLYNDTTRRIATEYKKVFNVTPPSYALEAYDSMWIVADAIQRAGTTATEAIISALEATDITLAQGHYYFRYTSKNPLPADGSVPKYMWHQWPDPAVLLLQYYQPNQDWQEAAVVWPPVYQTHGTSYIPYGTQPK